VGRSEGEAIGIVEAFVTPLHYVLVLVIGGEWQNDCHLVQQMKRWHLQKFKAKVCINSD
jgi:hypothetical protein